MESIRKRTCIVLRRGGEYFSGVDLFGRLRWSAHIYDSWRTRSMEKAMNIAIRIRAEMVLFNPVVGQSATIKFRRANDVRKA